MGPSPSTRLHDEQGVAVGIAEVEHWRYGAGHLDRTDANLGWCTYACDGLVDVDTERSQLRVSGVDVVGVEDDSCLHTGRIARSRGHERDASRSVRRVELNPPVAVPPWAVVALLEAELLVKLHRPILVSRRNCDELDPTKRAGRGGGHREPLSVANSTTTTPLRVRTHRRDSSVLCCSTPSLADIG